MVEEGCQRQPHQMVTPNLPTGLSHASKAVPGAVLLDSISTGPLGTSTSNRWTLRYVACIEPSLEMITWQLYIC